ncbi:CD15/CS22/SEF14 family fimbrial major subunit [Escherichia coli]|uniref:CD15/CS22/SEF14 family fimbrial major subunit n=1 Tax=Escherichia coli TaxID=562 RepID=UPI00163AE5E3|nr:CD15/CS22/SEF14 family fimbrial major subunit [Escherichia coli]EFC4407698.1 fimbrial protein SefA [Escherichia coli]EFU9520632.1 fimbrial protein SefA [Escherichia coli]EHR9044476.1 CD15/CS22/SEF14 family fimbrial major subunit [Escherichia coli]EKC6277658.1 CD15/CS22/SEF14 family fimbrial major subunit [Escherichia coli]MBC0015544.1 CD15/CS22/SEF14 family fimbrial major subunit [Escherichia coli]
MKKIILSSIAIAMAIGAVSAHAEDVAIGNTAVVKAPVTIAAANTTNATWTVDQGFTGPTVQNNQRIGSLSIQTTGAHVGVQITGEGARVNGGQVQVPFYDTNGREGFPGTVNDSSWLNVSQTVLGTPGFSIADATDSVSVDVLKAGPRQDVQPGVYTATFSVTQYTQ